ncbi:MAG: lysylphosphatidylglycerol synthase transmembrane domain-containing protein [Patescibacteria group bacterium]|nr:lysylphosphatidylglycerol synthase transmembrane domain-containing protein [Patescibacteria group bacterium]
MRFVKYFLVMIFILIAVFVIYPKLKISFHEIPLLFQEANKFLILLLLGLQVVVYLGDGWLSKLLLGIAGFPLSIRDTLKVAILGNLGNQTIPVTGGPAATYYFYRKLKVPPEGIFFLVWTWFISVWGVNLFFFLVALFFLPGSILGLIQQKFFFVFLVLFATLLFMSYFLLRNQGKSLFFILRPLLAFANKIGRHFHNKNFITPKRLKRFVAGMSGGLRFLWSNKSKLPKIILASSIFYLGTIATLYSAFLVFGFRPNPFYVIFGFTVSSILALLTFMPEAPGVIEASLSGVFVGLGFPAHIALFAAILFRFFSYWIFFPLGLHLFLTLRRKNKQTNDVREP